VRIETALLLNKGENDMTRSLAYLATALALCTLAGAASAQSVTRLPSPNANAPIVSAVTVPPGYTTYYISGTPAGPKNPTAPEGSADRWGDTTQQTADSLNKLEATLKQLGLNLRRCGEGDRFHRCRSQQWRKNQFSGDECGMVQALLAPPPSPTSRRAPRSR